MNIVGIDPGQKGGVCLIEWYQKKILNLDVRALPLEEIEVKKNVLRYRVDALSVKKILDKWNIDCSIDLVIIEKQICIKGQGISSTSTTMEGFGILQGICIGMGLKYKVIPAQVWQEHIFGKKHGKDTKALSVEHATKISPNTSFLRTPRCTTLSDGMTDAFLISYYGCLIDE